ncbi:MAG TPA: 2-oxo acid dehydrogenase subunit E2, partial [Vicinamibacterales bacterium]|nr:2-oxo acid dehydrogenase subunit E2 [Vicinamibacterales bacterium]
MTEFKIPELGENIASGDVTRVLVNVGDTIAREQPVLELETDKATIEVPSSVAGVVRDIKVKKGDKVKVGAVVLTVDGGSTAPAPQPKAAAKAADPPQAAAPAPAGPPRVVPMPARPAPEALPPPAAPAVKSNGGRSAGPAAAASPAVRRLAREIGVDVNEVQGTGPDGRISLEDVKEHARRILSSVPSTLLGASGAGGAAAGGAAARATRPLPDFQRWGEIERQPWTNIRRSTAERLSHAWTTIPHVTQFDKADVSALEKLRKEYKDQVAAAGGNLTITAMLVMVLATAVKKFPQFNASLDGERGEIVYKKYVNVGVAVDTEHGLLVPVIRNADSKNLTEIAVELHKAGQRARDRKLSLEDMSGGGITISN